MVRTEKRSDQAVVRQWVRTKEKRRKHVVGRSGARTKGRSGGERKEDKK